MRSHPLLQEAAIVSMQLGVDPVIVLAETDETRRAARLAAAQYVIDLRAEAAQR